MRAAKAIAIVLAALVLASGVFAARLALEALQSEEPSAELLYLPEGPYLRALALGHEQTAADLLYLWALNYYASYRPDARRGYLTAVFGGAITDLDPRFTEAYLIGALIMSLEYRRPDEALALYDKGLRAMPDNWELAYWAGWESYSARRYLTARDYWRRAAQMPGAPPALMRLAARMLERAGDLAAAIAEYERLLAETDDPKTRMVVERWLGQMRRQLAAGSHAPAQSPAQSPTRPPAQPPGRAP